MWRSRPSLSLSFSRPALLHCPRPLRQRSWIRLPPPPPANPCSFPSTKSRPCCSSPAGMDGSSDNSPPVSGCRLVVSGKSAAEKDQARSLASKASLKLKHDGEDMAVFLRAEDEESSSDSSVETFRTQIYMEALSASRFGRLLLWSPSLPSTQDVVSQNFVELPIGAACVADIQSRGRGRTKNVWESPSGCLMFSFTLEMEDGRVVPLLQYVVSLAITEAITEICLSKGLPPLDVRIKWPNDLYLNGLKIGGVLCTSTYKSKKFNVSAGIGLNLDNEKPTTSLNAVLRGMSSDSKVLEREEVLASFFNSFEYLFEKFAKEGFQVLEELYYKRWLHSGQRVEIEENLEKTAVTIQGLTNSGYLLATDDADNLFELHPDGNSLDFFKGLVRRKLP